MAEVTLTISAEDNASAIFAKVSQGLDKLSKGNAAAGAASRKAGEDATTGGKGFDQFAQSLNIAAGNLKNLLTPANLVGSVIGIGMVAALKHAIAETHQYAMEMQRLTLVTGASLSEIGELQDAASKLGVGAGTLQRAFFLLSSEIESGGRNLAKLGISTRDAMGQQRGDIELLKLMSTEFRKMSSATEQAVAAKKAFGRSAVSLLPVLTLTTQQIEELGESGREFNKRFGEDGVKAAIRLGGAVDEVKEAFMRMHMTMVSDLTPGIKLLADNFSHLVDIVWYIPKPIRLVVETITAMLLIIGGAVLAIKTLAGAFATLFAALHLPAIATAVTAIGSLAVPIAAVLAVLTGLLILGPQIKDFFASMIPQAVIDKWEQFKSLVSSVWEKLRGAPTETPAIVTPNEGDREQTLAELQIEIGLKHKLLQAQMALSKATKDSVSAELEASKVKQTMTIDTLNLELKKLSDRADADASILAERAKLEQLKTKAIQTGEAERSRIISQQAASRLQQATAVEQQYRAIRLSGLELEQTLALDGLESAKTANRQALEDFTITQEQMVQREVAFLQEELDIKLKYLAVVGQAAEERALEDRRLIEVQAKAAGEAAKDTALKINKIDADLAAARMDNASKVAQANIDAENKITAALRLTEAQLKKNAEETRKQIESAKTKALMFDTFGLDLSIKQNEEDKESLDKLISSMRTETQLEQERLSLLVSLKQLGPAQIHLQMNKELEKQIGFLKEAKEQYSDQPQLVKQIDMEILRLTDRIYTMRDALAEAFEGVSDILSILGIKLGKFILMLQQLPRVMSGFEKIGKSLGAIFGILGSASPAVAGQDGGQAGGILGMLGNLGGFLGMGGSNPAAGAMSGGANLFGMAGMAGGGPEGLNIFGMAGGQAPGMMSQIMGMLGPALLAGGIGYSIGKAIFGKEGGIGAGIGAAAGSLFGPLGALGGGLIGGGLGKLFGGLFGTTPKAKLKAKILPFDLDELTKGGLRDLDEAVRGTRVGAISVNVRGNIYKAKKEHKLEEEFTRALNDLFIDMVKGIKKLIPDLPKTVGAELDVALESLADEGLVFEKWSKSGSKAKKKLKKHLKDLPNQMIESVVEELGFGALDLKMMGGGDVAKGFEGLLGALGGLSAVLDRVTGSADTFTGTLAEFTDKSVEFFEGFRKGGETFTETVERVNQGFASLFGVMDQLDMEIGTAAGAGFQGLVEVYQRSVERVQELADAGLVAVESGASPDEVAAAAQALRDAMTVSQDVLNQIAAGLQQINAAMMTGIDLYADLEVRIQALGGAATSLDDLLNTAYSLAVTARNLGSQISIFESVLQVVGTRFETFEAALPRLSSAFGELMASIRSTVSNAEAVTQLQALAQAVVNGAQAAYQGIANGASRARDAAQSAADTRIQALEDERDAIQDIADKQQEAQQAQLDALRQWKSIAESAKAQLVDLFNLLAPTHPQTSFNEVLAQFRSAVGGFGPNSSPEAALQIQELAKQVLQLAQGVPGMDLSSAAFQSLAAEVKAALEAVRTVAENQPTEEELLAEIATSSNTQSTRLAEIEAAIRAEQNRLQQTLQSISNQEQSQIAYVNAQQSAALVQIRTELSGRLLALQAEQETARAILQQITGNLSFEQFIANAQKDSVTLLGQIRDVLKDYLGGILEGLGFPMPSARSGMPYVPVDGPVYLHRGERVLTARENQSTFGTSGGTSVVVHLTANGNVDAKKLADQLEKELAERFRYGRLNSAIKEVRS